MARKSKKKKTRKSYGQGGQPAAKRKLKYPSAKSGKNTRSGGFIDYDLKYLDTVYDGSVISTTISSSYMAPTSGGILGIPTEGDGATNRNGRKYVIKNIFVSGVITTSPTNALSSVTEGYGYYFALVLDTQNNATLGFPTNGGDIWKSQGGTAAAELPQPLRDLEYTTRFKILDHCYVPAGPLVAVNDYDNAATTNPTTSSLGPATSPSVKLSWSGEIPVQLIHGATTSSYTSVADNAIALMAIAGSSQFTPLFRGKARVRFIG